MLVVHKYGGTSVGSPERIRNVAEKVIAQTERRGRGRCRLRHVRGDGPASEAGRVAPELPDDREPDVLLSTGEQVTSALLAMTIKELGGDAVSLLGSQIRIVTDSAHGKARIEEIEGEKILSALGRDRSWLSPAFRASTARATSRRWAAAARIRPP